MLIIGAKGFAKEVLEVLHQLNQTENVAFYDDVNEDIGETVFGFPILKNETQVKDFFKKYGKRFTIGIGNPKYRYLMSKKMESLGGELVSTISPYSHIGHFGNIIQDGCSIMTGSVLTNDIKIMKGTLVNLNCTIGHDSLIEEFVELCPGVHVSGNCKIGKFTFVGTNATILPNVIVGENAIIGAGALINKDVPDNVVVIGTPGKIVKIIQKIDFI